MRIYHFALRNNVGDDEDLGCLQMSDDNEAIAFGANVVREITAEPAPMYSGSNIKITAGTRSVASISFDADSE